MAKAIVIYYSMTGNTKEMAEIIASAMNEAGLSTECKFVDKVKAEDLLDFDAIVVKQLFDDSVANHGGLDGKVAAAFSSSANVGGGNETTIMGIIEAMLIAGMVVAGDPQGDHYGPVSIGKPDERVRRQCRRKGTRIAELTLKLYP